MRSCPSIAFFFIECYISDPGIYPKEAMIMEHSSMMFNCSSRGKVKWKLMDGPLPINAEEQPGNILFINEARREDQGSYECEGLDNNLKPFKSTGRLNIKSKLIVFMLFTQVNLVAESYALAALTKNNNKKTKNKTKQKDENI